MKMNIVQIIKNKDLDNYLIQYRDEVKKTRLDLVVFELPNTTWVKRVFFHYTQTVIIMDSKGMKVNDVLSVDHDGDFYIKSGYLIKSTKRRKSI